MEALKSNNVLLPSARNEIVDALATIIMLETTHPSSQQLEKVAIKLVSFYPNIADKVPGGTAFVSVFLFIITTNHIMLIASFYFTIILLKGIMEEKAPKQI